MNDSPAPAALRVRVCIPHYVRQDGGDGRHGSGRPLGRAARATALSRCLGALLDLQRGPEDCLLHIGARAIQRLRPAAAPGPPLPPLSLAVTLCTDGEHQLPEVLALFAEEVGVQALPVDDPRDLALGCRDLLLGHLAGAGWDGDADLFLYLEDDLVIRDPLYLDKIAWFLEAGGHDWVLMPQRYERLHRDGLGVMLVDGPLRRLPEGLPPPPPVPEHLSRLRWPGGAEVRLQSPRNPHSGSFCLSRSQVERLRGLPLPRSGFIGPLETAATLTVLQHFPVLKPAPEHWRFLCLEHAHAGFRSYRDVLPEFMAPPRP